MDNQRKPRQHSYKTHQLSHKPQMPSLPNKIWNRILRFAFPPAGLLQIVRSCDNKSTRDKYQRKLRVRGLVYPITTGKVTNGSIPLSFFPVPVQLLRVNKSFLIEGRRLIYARPIWFHLSPNDVLPWLETLGHESRHAIKELGFPLDQTVPEEVYDYIGKSMNRPRIFLMGLTGVTLKDKIECPSVQTPNLRSALPLFRSLALGCLKDLWLSIEENNHVGHTAFDNALHTSEEDIERQVSDMRYDCKVSLVIERFGTKRHAVFEISNVRSQMRFPDELWLKIIPEVFTIDTKPYCIEPYPEGFHAMTYMRPNEGRWPHIPLDHEEDHSFKPKRFSHSFPAKLLTVNKLFLNEGRRSLYGGKSYLFGWYDGADRPAATEWLKVIGPVARSHIKYIRLPVDFVQIRKPDPATFTRQVQLLNLDVLHIGGETNTPSLEPFLRMIWRGTLRKLRMLCVDAGMLKERLKLLNWLANVERFEEQGQQVDEVTEVTPKILLTEIPTGRLVFPWPHEETFDQLQRV